MRLSAVMFFDGGRLALEYGHTFVITLRVRRDYPVRQLSTIIDAPAQDQNQVPDCLATTTCRKQVASMREERISIIRIISLIPFISLLDTKSFYHIQDYSIILANPPYSYITESVEAKVDSILWVVQTLATSTRNTL